MEKIIIAAIAANRVIGSKNTIPWHLPDELQRFKKITWGHALIMGRKTHESIGKPLPGRRNIIITRNRKYTAVGCETVHSLDEAYRICKNERKVFNAGGEELYRQGLDYADTIILTVLSKPYPGDVYFPEFSLDTFFLVAEEHVQADPRYTIQIYHRRNERCI
jgi:dihydrofolate reductase